MLDQQENGQNDVEAQEIQGKYCTYLTLPIKLEGITDAKEK